MTSHSPKVSILMSVYNGKDYLEEAIDSILNQTFKDFEFLIIDDCSMDNSWEILSTYAQADTRIRLIKNSENLGLTKSLNKGLNLAEGKYIARQDADDVSLPQRLEKQVAVMDADSQCVLVSCSLNHINKQGEVVENVQRACEPDLLSWYLTFYNRIAGHSQVMYRRDSVLSINGYDENRRYSQDYELWCRLAKLGDFHVLPDVLLLQRRHSNSITASKSGEQKSLSLSQSQRNLQELLHREISLKETQVLRGFWHGHWIHHRFPEHRYLPFLDSTLRDAAAAFIDQHATDETAKATLKKKIHRAIAAQYICWLQSPLTSYHTVWSKIKITKYALAWNAVKVPQAWLIWLIRFPFDTLASIFIKVQNYFQRKRGLGFES